jgi:hypothetical protein
MKTENPYQPPNFVTETSRRRISIVTAFWLIVFLLIFVFFAFESARQVLFGNAAIAVNLCVFYLPVLTILGWRIRKRILRELASKHKTIV